MTSEELETLVEAARHYLLGAATLIRHQAEISSDLVLFEQAATISACARLPGDMPLRVWCAADAFILQVAS
jgi:hypothetical protein